MDARFFNNIMSELNEEWAANTLGMIINRNGGPDLIDDKKGVEIKFCLTGNKCRAERYTLGWTVLEYQMNYGKNGLPFFWGLGTYELDRPISEIQTKNARRLERYVLSRGLWIVKYKWMEQFPPHKTSGQTKKSSWENTLRYPKFNRVPRTTLTSRTAGGLVRLTGGVDVRLFD